MVAVQGQMIAVIRHFAPQSDESEREADVISWLVGIGDDVGSARSIDDGGHFGW